MSSEEVRRRIETALAAGEGTLQRCEACGDTQTDCYRPAEEPESEVLTYCDDCADALDGVLIPSEDYHAP